MHLSTARFKSCSDTFGLSVRGAAVPSPSPRPILRRGRCKRPPHRQPPPATLPTVALTSPPLRRRTAGSPGERNAPHSACAVGVAVLVSSDPIRPAAAASRLRLTGQPAGPPDHLAGRRASSGRPRPPLGLWLSCMLLPWPAAVGGDVGARLLPRRSRPVRGGGRVGQWGQAASRQLVKGSPARHTE